MKYVLSIIGLVCLVAVGCTNNQTPTPASSTVTQEEYTQVVSLNEELNELLEYLENDFRFFLYLMDRDLDAVEQGREPRGSFSDYFVPNAAKALKAGASREDITTRIDRVVALAKKEIYLSGYVAQLMKEGGPTAVRSYVADVAE
ncbi:MAG: hypothetical protein COS98_02270 [Parcubacteria group bacterium CG07_land_8_20_14_0_80_35_11]|nr:MAG: hypothetical protein COS98_02270 [Parcubacteria group bacterium CG07_land_8_20_14_0_80_35_11]